MPTIHLLIRGKVQGVYYRASAREAAEKLQITGWIKNTPDGHVEAIASGDEQNLQQFVAWCRQGPPGARVTEVVANPATAAAFSSFSIVRG